MRCFNLSKPALNSVICRVLCSFFLQMIRFSGNSYCEEAWPEEQEVSLGGVKAEEALRDGVVTD